MGKTFLLDLDGTLADPYTGISRCIVHALKMLQAPRPTANELRNWIGPPLATSFEAWFTAHAIDADPGQAVILYRERFSRIGLFENEVYPGIPALLADLSGGGNHVLLATSKPAVYARRILEHFSLADYFSAAFGSQLDGRYSDKRALLGMIIEQQKLDAADCVMIGDRRHDIDAAQVFGMASVGVLWGYGSRAELEDAGAGRIVASVEELKPVLMP